jgi:ribosomal protein S18 acetylase RimI-like enzyme
MEPENLDIESITEARRKAIEKTIEPISIEQLKSLGEKIFPFFDHPWRDTFFQFVEENRGSTFYHATTDDQLEIIYCPDKEKVCGSSGEGCRPIASQGT